MKTYGYERDKMYVNCINVIKPQSNIMHKWKWKIKADRRKLASGMKRCRKWRRAEEEEEEGERERNTNIRGKIRLHYPMWFLSMYKQWTSANIHTRKTHEKLIITRYKLVSVCTIWLIKNYLGCIDMPMILVVFIAVYHIQIS